MTGLIGCPRCGRTLAECPSCGAAMRQGVCQTSRDVAGRLTAQEDYYCPNGCDGAGAYATASRHWLESHPCAGAPETSPTIAPGNL